jgi:hypothetical protein
MPMTEYDKENLQAVLSGHGTWFTAKLLRLISRSDRSKMEQMHLAFPEEVELVYQYQNGKCWEDRNE